MGRQTGSKCEVDDDASALVRSVKDGMSDAATAAKVALPKQDWEEGATAADPKKAAEDKLWAGGQGVWREDAQRSDRPAARTPTPGA